MRAARCLVLYAFLQLLFYGVKPTHVTGLWNGKGYEFLHKFAIISGRGHQIHLYGSFSNNSEPATLLFVPSKLWKDLNKQVDKNKGSYNDDTCKHVMRSLCDKAGINAMDYIRQVPCYDDNCQPESVNLVPGSQITYTFSDSTQFYYAILVACVRSEISLNNSCDWISRKGSNMRYDVWFVSGDPLDTKHNSLTYQFSYHEHGVIIVLIIVVILYGVLLPFHLIGYTWLLGKCEMPNFVKVFTVALFMELIGVGFALIHYSVYADDGKGVMALYDLGFFFEVLADYVLLLIVLLIAKGYRITISVIRQKRLLFVVWSLYFIAVIAFVIWALFGLSARSDKNAYQEWAGGLLLAWRMLTLIYALFELRSTYLQEDDPVRVRLYVIFFVACLAWFLYLPIMVIIAAIVNSVYRAMIITTSIRIMDFTGFLGMAILLYPYWSGRYFQFSHWFTEDEAARLI